MSRCYPFPPPGYERKPRSDDVDLITKEKQKEKKHKKEKKDKEKREGKDRKEKNRSKDKHKEKKERKEKDKEKRRHKDRDKEKLPDGSNFEEITQGVNEEKFPDSSRKVEDAKYSKLAEELSERCRDNGASGRIHKDFNSSDHKAEGLGAWESLEKEIFHGNEMAVNHISKNHNRSNGLSKDAEKKLQGSEKAREQPPLVINLVSRDNTKYVEGARTMHKELVKRDEERHEISEKNKMGGEKSQENQTKNNVLDQELEKLPGKPKQKDNNKPEKANLIVQEESKHEWQMSTHAAIDIGGSEKSEDKKVDGGKSNHHGNKDQTEKKHKKKDKDKRKKEKEAKRDRREKRRDGKEHDKTKVVQEKTQVYTQDLAAHKGNEKYVDIDENFRKRRYQEINGLLHAEGDLRPSKLPKPLPSLPLHVENGRTVTLCGSASNKAGGMNCKIDENHSLNHVNHRINGTPSVGSKSSVAANASQKHEVSLKPPHPDTKYLNIIYSVPKIEEWPEADNQDWLFHKDGHWPKPKSDVKIDEPTTQVWSEALIIESPRVIALPYVIPF